MKTIELEKKLIIDKSIYEFLISCFEANASKHIRQINYYYDTNGEQLRHKNITCRIRQKEDKLTGTLKKHCLVNGCPKNTEETFLVKSLPMCFEVAQQIVILKGSMITDRTEIQLSADMLLVLDKNTYLGAVDYELEIEYSESGSQEAEGVLKLFEKLFGVERNHENILSKSERFFRKFESLPGQALLTVGKEKYD